MTKDTPLVLIVEDDARMRRLLRSIVRAHGFRTAEAASLKQGVELAANARPDVAVLDLMLPDGDGVDLVRRVRDWSRMPIVVLTVQDQQRDKVRALDAGADDYVTKPFGAEELMARVRAVLRRAMAVERADAGGPLIVGDLQVDLVRRLVKVRGQPVRLTPTEYRLLAVLFRNAGAVVTHQRLLQEVWGPHKTDQIHYARIYMVALRRKLEANPLMPRYLLTEPGVGYRLADNV